MWTVRVQEILASFCSSSLLDLPDEEAEATRGKRSAWVMWPGGDAHALSTMIDMALGELTGLENQDCVTVTHGYKAQTMRRSLYQKSGPITYSLWACFPTG